jgi:hypothetical protein
MPMKSVYTTAQSRYSQRCRAASFTRGGRTQLACRSASADLDNRGVCCPRFQRSQTPSVCLASRSAVRARFRWRASRTRRAADRWVLRRQYSVSAGWCEGVVAQMRGDKAAAHAAFTSARAEAAKMVLRNNLIMRKRFVCSGWLTLPWATRRTQFVKAAARSNCCR